MGLRVTGLYSTMQRVENMGERSSRAALKGLRQGAQEILELSVRMVPVDEGNLEEAHKLEEDRQGINHRVRIYVYVDPNVPVAGASNKTTGDYANKIHEKIGWENLGPKSLAKQAGDPGVEVGSHFLTRAMEKRRGSIDKVIKRAVIEALIR